MNQALRDTKCLSYLWSFDLRADSLIMDKYEQTLIIKIHIVLKCSERIQIMTLKPPTDIDKEVNLPIKKGFLVNS